MDYYGLLFLYYLKGLSGKSILRLFFNIEVGGTEQLFPENTSTPTTTPILADIQYPDELRTDQYFTYRETPTTVSNKARIKTIKGNTLVWNQVVNTSFTTTTLNGITFTNNGDGSITVNGTSTGFSAINVLADGLSFPITNGHKYLFTGGIDGGASNTYRMDIRADSGATPVYQLTSKSALYRATSSYDATVFIRIETGYTANNLVYRPQIFDLTQMGLDITDPTEFTSLFSLPYYAYNQGTLLSFMGNGIKTVGKNQYNNAIGLRNLYLNQNTGLLGNGGTTYVADLLTNKQYTLSGTRGNRSLIGFSKKQANELGNGDTIENISSVSLPYTFNSSDYHSVVYYSNTEYVATLGTDVQLEFGSVASDFEPYTSSTLSLPISTYFSNGMKSADTAYDELTPSKATTRVRQLILDGTQTPRLTGITLNQVFSFDDLLASAPCKTVNTNITSTYEIGPSYATVAYGSPKVAFSTVTTPLLIFPSGRFNDVSELLTYLQSNPVPINYELATPTETPITTEDANEALSLLMGKSVSSNNAKQMIDIITKGE